MGIFGKLFGALKKTKDNLSEKLRVLFSKNKLGDEFYEELEELLISSDVSVSTAEEVSFWIDWYTELDCIAVYLSSFISSFFIFCRSYAMPL